MELIRKKIHMSRQKAKVNWQMTMHEDYQVPDHKEEISQVILYRGKLENTTCKAEEERIRLDGTFLVSVLYGERGNEQNLQTLSCPLHFSEMVHMEGVKAGDSVRMKWVVEDVRVTLVHSRKVSIQALITFTFVSEVLEDEELPVAIEAGESVETRMQKISVAQVVAQKRDTCRVRDEGILPMNQPNIAGILWQEMELRGVDVRFLEGQVQLKGELEIFLFYRGEEEPEKIWWMSHNVPFTSRIDCPGCEEQMIGQVDVELMHGDVEVKPDYDGELRVLNVEAILDVHMKIFGEEQFGILTDLACPTMELKPEMREVQCENVLGANASRCRAMERLPIKESEEPILQILYASGEVKVDVMQPTEQGLRVEGAVQVQILYVTASDRQPYRTLKGVLPFEHVLEASGMQPDSAYHLNASLEQLHAVMVNGREVEVKAVVLLNGLFSGISNLHCIEHVEEAPLDLQAIKNLPGMVIYVVQQGDSLWDIAKRYRTTMERIRTLNGLSSQEVKTGQKLLLIKELGSRM